MKLHSGTKLGLVLAVTSMLSYAVGCEYRSTRQAGTVGKASGGAQTQYRADVLRSAVAMLNEPERFDDENKASEQIVEQLAQWIRMVRETKGVKTDGKVDDDTAIVAVDWQRDPLIDTLPESLRRTRAVLKLPSESFDLAYDGEYLREAALLRDVSSSIQSKFDDLSVGTAYFDWVVRNIQVENQPDEDSSPAERWLGMHLPLETLYFGRGTPLCRAWVFMLLARQQGLETVLLAMPGSKADDPPRPWGVGLISGDNIYLFDYTYGLPIPGPEGKGVATLAQAAADDSILRQMDIPGGRVYPRKAADLEKTIALIESSPGSLSRRMKLLESYLTGRDRLVLTNTPSTLAEKLRGKKNIAEVKLWTLPFEIVAGRQSLLAAAEDETSKLRPAALIVLRERDLERFPFTLPVMPEEKRSQSEGPTDDRPESREEIRRRQRKVLALRLGRLLHLRGIYGGVDVTQEAAKSQDEEVSEIVERGAKAYYLRAMLTKQELDDVSRMMRDGFELAPGHRITPETLDAMQRMRDDAAYWLGLIWCSAGGESSNRTAAEFLQKMTLDSHGNNQWVNGAQYNLARVLEANGKLAEAIDLYEADRSPQRYGNRLRAQRLKEQMAKAAKAPPADSGKSQSAGTEKK